MDLTEAPHSATLFGQPSYIAIRTIPSLQRSFSMKSRRLAVSVLALGLTAAVVMSCRDSSPVAPAARQGTPEADLLSPLQQLGLLKCTPLPPASASQTIGSAGGTMHIGPHTFVVPAGALDHPVTISAYAPSSQYNQVQFEPEGLQFARPASLTMSYSNCNLLGILLPKHIAYVDGNLNILYLLLSVDDIFTEKVTGQVDHFSDYATAW
jgi:hypothetical protein